MSESREQRTPEEIEADIEATREELGDTVEALAAKTDVKGRAKAKVEETKEKVEEAKETISEKISGVTDSTGQGATGSGPGAAEQATAVIKENPEKAALAGAFAAGLLAGWIIRGR